MDDRAGRGSEALAKSEKLLRDARYRKFSSLCSEASNYVDEELFFLGGGVLKYKIKFT